MASPRLMSPSHGSSHICRILVVVAVLYAPSCAQTRHKQCHATRHLPPRQSLEYQKNSSQYANFYSDHILETYRYVLAHRTTQQNCS